jgi:hypothetical protein
LNPGQFNVLASYVESGTGRIGPKILRLGNIKLVVTPDIFYKVAPLTADNKSQTDLISQKLLSCPKIDLRVLLTVSIITLPIFLIRGATQPRMVACGRRDNNHNPDTNQASSVSDT